MIKDLIQTQNGLVSGAEYHNVVESAGLVVMIKELCVSFS